MNINYSISDCFLGKLLIAATGKGICAVSLGNSADILETSFLDKYPKATQNHNNLGMWINKILSHLNGEELYLDFPLDIQGTNFQWQVWEKVRQIPYGKTQSYSEIAKSLGIPKAARAVANACASNKVALIIPCHRVIRKDNSLGGYRWNVKVKEALLKQEKYTLNLVQTSKILS